MFVNIFLFDGFHTMGAFGPAQIFGGAQDKFCIRYISMDGGIITSQQGVKVWTEPLNPKEIEGILLIPGGPGIKCFLHFVGERIQDIKQAVSEADYCLMVENGSAVLAKAGVLYHRQAADYAYDENWKRMFTVGVNYVADMKWLEDGKYYSCSDMMSALDMTLGAVSDIEDLDVAEKIARQIGYETDSI